MLGTQWFLLFAAAVGLCHADPPPVPAGHVLHETRGPIQQQQWARKDRVAADAVLPVRIALVQSNLDKGHDLLMELSSPGSPKYGQWMSAEEVHDFFAPPAESVDLVREWIKSVGIADKRIVYSENKGWLAVDATVQEAEKLLATTFYEYEHSNAEKLKIGSDSYYVPGHLVNVIDYVTPALKMSSVKKVKGTFHLKRTSPERAANPAARAGRASFRHINEDQPVKEGGDAFKRDTTMVDAENVLNGPSPNPDSTPNDKTNDKTKHITPPSTPGLDPVYRDCASNMSITCVRYLYDLPATPCAVEGNSVGIFETGDYFDQLDLDLTFTNWAPWVPNGTQPIPALIDGAQYNTDVNGTNAVILGEAIWDIVTSQALVYPQNVTLYQVDDPFYAREQIFGLDGKIPVYNTFFDAIDGSYCTYSAFGRSGNDPKIDPIYPNPNTTVPGSYQGQLMCGTYKPTKVISISYGGAELNLPISYQKRVCNEVLKLGLQGTTVVMSTGDDGTASFSSLWPPDGCIGPDNHRIFNPSFMVSCPYTLAVGATMIYENQTVQDAESVMNTFIEPFFFDPARNFTTGGGFSNIFPRPSYQEAAVQEYFDKHSPPYPYYSQLEPDFAKVKGIYNRIGRGYPDLSANGYQFPAYEGGGFGTLSGTSLAAPVIASIITMINQERALVGKSSVGFVQPVLYANPQIFNDITNGTNLGCGTNGFKAVCGWDPSSGLGTVKYPKMRELFLSLP